MEISLWYDLTIFLNKHAEYYVLVCLEYFQALYVFFCLKKKFDEIYAANSNTFKHNS